MNHQGTGREEGQEARVRGRRGDRVSFFSCRLLGWAAGVGRTELWPGGEVGSLSVLFSIYMVILGKHVIKFSPSSFGSVKMPTLR